MKMVWRFMQYVAPSGCQPVADWLADQTPAVRQNFKVLLRNLAKTSVWQQPEFKRFTGDKKLAGLGEIRVKGDKQYRIIGMNGPAKGQYTLLLGCTHKQQVYDPPEAKDTVYRRRKAIENGEADVARFGSSEGS